LSGRRSVEGSPFVISLKEASMMTTLRRFTAAQLSVLLLAPGLASAQRSFSQPELDRLLAPVALYPGPLLSQVLMAATYPADPVEAARWSHANPHLTGDNALLAAAGENWDPSVVCLLAFRRSRRWCTCPPTIRSWCMAHGGGRRTGRSTARHMAGLRAPPSAGRHGGVLVRLAGQPVAGLLLRRRRLPPPPGARGARA